MRPARQALAVAALSSRWLVRQPPWLVQSLVYAAGLAAMVYVWGGPTGLRHVLVAFVVSSMWSTGLNIVAQEVGWDRVARLIDIFIASPLSPSAYYLGLMMGSLLYTIAVVLPVYALMAYLGFTPQQLLAVVLVGLVTYCLGMLLGLYVVLSVRNPTNISAITNPLVTMTTMLPPIYYPATALPETVRPIALLSPTTPLMDLARAATGMPVGFSVQVLALSVTAWALLLALVAPRKARWGLPGSTPWGNAFYLSSSSSARCSYWRSY